MCVAFPRVTSCLQLSDRSPATQQVGNRLLTVQIRFIPSVSRDFSVSSWERFLTHRSPQFLLQALISTIKAKADTGTDVGQCRPTGALSHCTKESVDGNGFLINRHLRVILVTWLAWLC